MRWTTARVTIICFSLSLVTACAGVLAQHPSNSNMVSNSPRVEPSVGETEQPAPLQPESAPQFDVSFETVEMLGSGRVNAETVKLRDSPQAVAKVIGVLRQEDYGYVEIIGATRDYLRVRLAAAPDAQDRESAREGWVAWGEVVPSASAIVLDTETGAVISRLPLNEAGSSPTSATFSPDNSRAVIYGDYQAYEVSTEDYTLTRSFNVKAAADTSLTSTYFYGSSDGRLYAAFQPLIASARQSNALVNILRVPAASGAAPQPEISEAATAFVLSPDGRKGFILHPVNAKKSKMLVDVLDLQGMRVSHTLTLRGDNLPSAASQFVTNADGSILYAGLFPSREVISVIETDTGRLLREIPTGSLKERAQYFSQNELVGDSFLFRLWEGEESEESHSVWFNDGKVSRAQRGVDYAVEANGVRLAVNDAGTRLYKLDADNRIREKYWIDRPDVRLDQSLTEYYSMYSLIISPDGKHVILILGEVHGC